MQTSNLLGTWTYYCNKSIFKKSSGVFIENLLHGQGKFKTWGGTSYSGQFDYGKLCGQATIKRKGEFFVQGEVEKFLIEQHRIETMVKLGGETKLALLETNNTDRMKGSFIPGQKESSPMASELASEESNNKL